MTQRIYMVVLLATLGLTTAGASGAHAEDFQRVHLKAGASTKTWQSNRVLPHDRALSFGIYIGGREVDQRGIASHCRFSLMTQRLALELRSCGNAPLSVRFVGDTSFTVTFKLGGH
jgi:hypothetical protein